MEWLGYAFVGSMFGIAALLAVAVVLMLFGSAQYLVAGVGLVLASSLVDTLTLNSPLLHVGIALYPGDLMSLVLTPVTIGRMLLLQRRARLPAGWWVFVLAILISLGTGLASFGTAAGVQARDYYYFMIVVLYVATFEASERALSTVVRGMAWLALALITLAVYRWVVYYTPITELLPRGGVYNVDGPIRVIWSADAMLIGSVTIAALFHARFLPMLLRLRPLLPLLVGVVLVLQHRSVWVAVLAGVVASVFVAGRAKTMIQQAALFAVMLALVLAPLALSGGELGGQIGQSATRALQGQDTTSDRLQGWTAMIEKWRDAGPRSIVIGNSFGSDNSRYVLGSEGERRRITYTAHNMYVQTLFNTGLLGLLGFVAALAAVLIRLFRAARRADSAWPARLLFVLNAMLMMYLIPYGLSYVQGLVFGAGLVWAAAARQAAAPANSGTAHASAGASAVEKARPYAV